MKLNKILLMLITQFSVNFTAVFQLDLTERGQDLSNKLTNKCPTEVPYDLIYKIDKEDDGSLKLTNLTVLFATLDDIIIQCTSYSLSLQMKLNILNIAGFDINRLPDNNSCYKHCYKNVNMIAVKELVALNGKIPIKELNRLCEVDVVLSVTAQRMDNFNKMNNYNNNHFKESELKSKKEVMKSKSLSVPSYDSISFLLNQIDKDANITDSPCKSLYESLIVTNNGEDDQELPEINTENNPKIGESPVKREKEVESKKDEKLKEMKIIIAAAVSAAIFITIIIIIIIIWNKRSTNDKLVDNNYQANEDRYSEINIEKLEKMKKEDSQVDVLDYD